MQTAGVLSLQLQEAFPCSSLAGQMLYEDFCALARLNDIRKYQQMDEFQKRLSALKEL